jgi:hypothetical protein
MVLVAGVFLAWVVGVLVTHDQFLAVVLLAGLVPLAIAFAVTSPSTSLVVLILWTAVLGSARRIVEAVANENSTVVGEPLLVVGPFIVVLLFLVARHRGALRHRSPLGQSVYWLTALVLLETANPLQGGVRVGVGGLLLLLPPLLMFWVGRGLTQTVLLGRLLGLVGGLSVAGAIYGLVQQFVGFPSWDESWIALVSKSSYIALNVGGVIRSFSSFASAQEYSLYLGVGLVVWLAIGLRATRIVFVLPFVALVAVAEFLISGRSAIVSTVAAVGVMLCARGGLRGPTALVGGIAAVALLSVVAGQFSVGSAAPRSANASTTSALIGHQLGGLGNPFNSSTSTLTGHLERVWQGIEEGFTQPLGHGTGSTSAASAGSGASVATEIDISNSSAGFGLAGLALYLLVLFRAISWAYSLAKRRKDTVTLATLGILLVTINQWLNGGLYSTSILIWLCMGWLDRQHGYSDRVDEDLQLLRAPAP